VALIDLYEDSQVAVITLDDGAHGNLLSPEGLGELAAALDRSQKDRRVRAILLRSNGPAFCLGMDLARWAAPESRASLSVAENAVDQYASVLKAISSSTMPVVCLVEGEVKAGGVGLVCACDIVLAGERASFELGEVIFGLIPANVLPMLALRMAPQKARYLVLSSRRITAPEALRLNLVDEILPGRDGERRIRDIFKRILCSSPRALAAAKEFTAELIGKTPEEGSVLARRRLLELMHDPSTLDGITAFQHGHAPAWFSRFRPERPLIPLRGGADREGPA
jgi:enoyl-CoA hydratase/carnithine racemase